MNELTLTGPLHRLAAESVSASTVDAVGGALAGALHELLGPDGVYAGAGLLAAPDGFYLQVDEDVAIVVERELAAAEVADVEALAAVAANGLARLEAERMRAARSTHDQALVRAARALNATLELREVLQTLSREAALAVGADLAGVYLGNDTDGGIATAGYGVPDEWHGLTLLPGEGAAGKALATGRTYATDDYHRDVAPTHPVLSAYRTACAVPMAWNGELKGALSVGWTEPRAIDEHDRRTLEAIADLATVACHNAETYEQVHQAARTDALTGLLNHGAMQVRLREEIARARRDATPLALVIIDLDDFKRVNDQHGHQAGDELLRRVAALLQAELRPYDQVARYGGDEFVLLLPGSDEVAARQVAERVRDAVKDGRVGGCSLGVAQWHDPLAADELVEHADRALMLAKRTGKGRVAVANADVERELALVDTEGGSPTAVQALAAAIEERDNYTHQHSEEVVHLARGVAMMLGLPSAQVERIADAALLHDVGKLGVPHEILHKRGTADPRGVGDHGRPSGRRRAHPDADPGADRDRADRAPRARALGRQRLPGRPARPPHPDRLADHPRLRLLPRDDHGPSVPVRPAGGRGDRRAAPRRRRAVRPRHRRVAAGPARPPPADGAGPRARRADARRAPAARARQGG